MSFFDEYKLYHSGRNSQRQGNSTKHGRLIPPLDNASTFSLPHLVPKHSFWLMAGLEPSATNPKCLNISVALERRELMYDVGFLSESKIRKRNTKGYKASEVSLML